VKTLGFIMVFCLVVVTSSLAQPAVPPAEGNSTNGLAVRLWLPKTAEPLHAPATVHIFARITSTAPGHPGDKAQVDFFASANPIGSEESFWRKGMKPDPYSHLPQPMIVSLPGFSPATLVWSNVPAGTFTLTARARTGGVTAESPPVSVTILP
jgi:hypothetical protein